MQPTGVLETSKATNPLRTLLECGQSVWLDYIRRDLITSGKLKRLIDEDGLRGITSNPAIFEKAIAESSDYDGILKELASRPELNATTRFEQIAIRDIQDAADLLRPVYESSKFRDGFVSLRAEGLYVPPHAAGPARNQPEAASALVWGYDCACCGARVRGLDSSTHTCQRCLAPVTSRVMQPAPQLPAPELPTPAAV